MTTIDKFESAVDYYRKGDLCKAEITLTEMLNLEPNNPDALHLLGIVYYHSKNFNSAEKCLRRSIDLNPEEAFAYFNLANILKDNQKLDEAMTYYQEALRINPGLGDAYYNSGIICEEKGQIDEAETYYKKALEINAQDAAAYNNLGVILQRKGRTDEAITCYEKALYIKADNGKTHYNLGVAFHARKQFDAAVDHYQRALQLTPDFAEALNGLGNAFKEKGMLDRAITCYEKTLEIQPDRDDTYYNLGIVFREKGLFDEAINSYQKSIQFNPNRADTYNNLGIVLQDSRQVDEAIACYRRALEMNCHDAVTHWNLSQALLLNGDLREGWREYEWRLKVKDFYRPNFPRPLWDGSDIPDRTILLYAEQGFGDSIQFVRYAPLLAQSGAKVIVYCPKELSSLLQNVEGVNETVVYGERIPDYDFYCPLPGLPLRFGTTIDNIPAEIPYIKADDTLVERWRDKVDDDGYKFKIGLVWAGREQRSFSLDLFSPLLKLDDAVFYSLQKGEAAGEKRNFPRYTELIDYTEELYDFSDTCAFIKNLDLIITVDTAVAHLSGALGKPVWTLLPFAPDWRWMLSREDSPWYPTMRLFRQTSIGDWSSVMARITAELQEELDASTHNRSDKLLQTKQQG